jgi:hypothetical protein
MPEPRKKVAPKTYLCRYPAFSCSFMVEGDDGEKVSDTIRFIGGEFTTDFEDEQKHLEALTSVIITVKPSPRTALEAKAKDLRAAAVKANAVAKEAEDALAALDKTAAKPAA